MKIMSLLVALLTVSACGTKVEPPQVLPIELNTDKTELVFTEAGGTLEFTVVSQNNPDLSPWDDWYKLKKGTWSNSKVTVTVTAEANETSEERVSKVSVVCGDDKTYVEIKQAAGTGQGNGATTDPVPQPVDNPAWKMASGLGIGWNLGNHFDAYNNGVSGETFWGNPKATEETFKKVKGNGRRSQG